eukprot:TRINITY_DN1468_c0_g1_i1.p1 TRINITY_DN1468_c0_g1~~TRINITY_DN1468_c0_g1_i1.p1  ORF type:complete len:420 (-),score=113.18 TRINITY_DN1468_c0_g1_i1:21-1280(-)
MENQNSGQVYFMPVIVGEDNNFIDPIIVQVDKVSTVELQQVNETTPLFKSPSNSSNLNEFSNSSSIESILIKKSRKPIDFSLLFLSSFCLFGLTCMKSLIDYYFEKFDNSILHNSDTTTQLCYLIFFFSIQLVLSLIGFCYNIRKTKLESISPLIYVAIATLTFIIRFELPMYIEENYFKELYLSNWSSIIIASELIVILILNFFSFNERKLLGLTGFIGVICLSVAIFFLQVNFDYPFYSINWQCWLLIVAIPISSAIYFRTLKLSLLYLSEQVVIFTIALLAGIYSLIILLIYDINFDKMKQIFEQDSTQLMFLLASILIACLMNICLIYLCSSSTSIISAFFWQFCSIFQLFIIQYAPNFNNPNNLFVVLANVIKLIDFDFTNNYFIIGFSFYCFSFLISLILIFSFTFKNYFYIK